MWCFFQCVKWNLRETASKCNNRSTVFVFTDMHRFTSMLFGDDNRTDSICVEPVERNKFENLEKLISAYYSQFIYLLRSIRKLSLKMNSCLFARTLCESCSSLRTPIQSFETVRSPIQEQNQWSEHSSFFVKIMTKWTRSENIIQAHSFNEYKLVFWYRGKSFTLISFLPRVSMYRNDY